MRAACSTALTRSIHLGGGVCGCALRHMRCRCKLKLHTCILFLEAKTRSRQSRVCTAERKLWNTVTFNVYSRFGWISKYACKKKKKAVVKTALALRKENCVLQNKTTKDVKEHIKYIYSTQNIPRYFVQHIFKHVTHKGNQSVFRLVSNGHMLLL